MNAPTTILSYIPLAKTRGIVVALVAALLVALATLMNPSDVRAGGPPSVTVNGAEIFASIDYPGEYQWHWFEAPASGTYTIRTSLHGLPDTVIVLWSAGGGQIAQNDDADGSWASRITTSLSPGYYWVGVYAYGSNQTGSYGLRVTTGGGPQPTVFTPAIWVDRGAGARYEVGNFIRICYHLNPENVPYYFEITRQSNGGPVELVTRANDNGIGGGDCIDGTVGGPNNVNRTLTLTIWVQGRVVTAQTYFTVGNPNCGGVTAICQ